MRRFFRKYLPFVEALLYADGNVFHDPDGNSAYRSYLVYLTRILFSAVYGLVMAIILSYAFIPNPSNIVAPVEASGASKSPAFSAGKQGKPDAEDLRKGRSTWEQKAETARVSTTRRLFLIARVLLYFAFSLASTMSRRVRCFLTLLVPSLGLSAGQSFMAAELLYITVTGPVTTITRNLQSGASTLECLMELSNNMTRDLHRMGTADLFNMEGELEMMDPKESDDDEWDGLNELSAKSQKLTTLFSRMTERIVKEFTTKLKKGVNVLESTVSSMQQMVGRKLGFNNQIFDKMQDYKKLS
ncbi:unnamed protein product [Protopolystoma xenopodis]|uniref:Uncharacterized protein n=1 Tax=Protopolystoma xenopodis TaxID=117903 RepID=A0A3S5CB13_9PLAT|nr:unnamed protein product [Protopolystoma xenopodis]